MSSVTLLSPAKLNLFLAVTGRRADGFHDLVSLAAPVEFGDDLQVELTPGPEFVLDCDDPALATDETNLVIRAAKAFKRETAYDGGARFVLRKRIPQGAGLGGGSSNATTTLLALNQLTHSPLTQSKLSALASEIGSDCALFLHNRAVVMRGRGEKIETLPDAVCRRLSGRRVCIIKPSFGIATPWAYRALAAEAPRLYLPAEAAERRLASWLQSPAAPIESLLYNSFETVAFRKFVALPALLDSLPASFGLTTAMSGSGSACYAFLSENIDAARCAALRQGVQDAWGREAWVAETRLR